MRIALLNDDALPHAKGGAAVIVEKLERGYKERGHETLLVTTHQDAALGRVVQTQGRVSLLSSYPRTREHRHCLGSPEMHALLADVFHAWQPEAVHAHNIHHHVTYESLLLAKHHTEKILLTAHDTLLVSYNRVRGPRFEKAALQGRPLKLHWWENALDAGRKYWPPRNRVIRQILKESATSVVAISDAVAQFLQVNGIPVRATIPNGIEVWNTPPSEAIQSFKKRYGITGPAVLFVGRVREDKGIRVLLQAMDRVLDTLPNAQCVVNGERDHLAPHLACANERVQQSVVATGWISREDTTLSYYAADIVTTPSLYLDNFPTVNLEAMAAGKPVVGTCFGGTPEVVQHGITGFILNPHNTSELGNALTMLLKDPEQAKKMGQAGRNRICEKFSLEKQSDTYLTLMNAL
ncbi:glycosyltransferase family 4 protein [Candidatus Peribacteria bacterium]|nr:glycosyltransferase family 4 protein [Candidatus Peribacteria bacterium]MBM3231690.1 glycosyltransferase family 4 protein [Candidatus Peregrinibacteria bacterium]